MIKQTRSGGIDAASFIGKENNHRFLKAEVHKFLYILRLIDNKDDGASKGQLVRSFYPPWIKNLLLLFNTMCKIDFTDKMPDKSKDYDFITGLQLLFMDVM